MEYLQRTGGVCSRQPWEGHLCSSQCRGTFSLSNGRVRKERECPLEGSPLPGGSTLRNGASRWACDGLRRPCRGSSSACNSREDETSCGSRKSEALQFSGCADTYGSGI